MPRPPEELPNPYWNHNVHYHRLVLGAVPDGCARALDIGCGDGLLARKLARRIPEVTGVDRSPAMIRLARDAGARSPNATFVEADFLAADESLPGGYDFLCAVAVLHHLDFTAAIRRMAALLAPGGRLVVIGLARTRTPLDWLISGAGVPAARLLARRHGGMSAPSGMPIQDADMTWGEIRRAARDMLPGSRFRRHLLWRYALMWDKPRS
ncbi:class I SAM-dependent methyltransferase [Streptomyces kronopolitis]|uniref:class I SAM-dependent methyltransferase n=1 Tax=Streptomyces kronopolitis TaxID=1612435 RepID=UPI0020BF9061|nr:class I SAM-dependent methyltransferase [Streptomyces kronopolitis]MCL6298943.1 class I SAM-dependent methyltransferase [Streptomyces kronopolitis]